MRWCCVCMCGRQSGKGRVLGYQGMSQRPKQLQQKAVNRKCAVYEVKTNNCERWGVMCIGVCSHSQHVLLLLLLFTGAEEHAVVPLPGFKPEKAAPAHTAQTRILAGWTHLHELYDSRLLWYHFPLWHICCAANVKIRVCSSQIQIRFIWYLFNEST